MNTPSPLMPQGALPPKPSNSIYFKILMVMGIHVVVISGLLLQGCKDTPKDTAKDTSSSTAATDSSASNPAPIPAPPPVDTSAPTAAIPSAPNVTPSNTGVAGIPGTTNPSTIPAAPIVATPAPVVAPVVAPVAAPAVATGHDYVVAKGDTLAAIAKKNGVSLRALEEANTGLNPRKLHVGQKIQIPTSGSSVASSATGVAGGPVGVANTTDAADSSIYVVKPGDMLFKIAKAHGTRVKAIMELNDLKTTSIRVGQKLKLPSKMATDLPAASSRAAQTAATPIPSVPATATAPSGSAN